MSDSRVQTYEHIQQVQRIISLAIADLQHRQLVHDQSKLKSPEVEIFDQFTDQLSTTTYGSNKYNEFLEKMKPALDHHYSTNSHHPQFFNDGIKGMSLLDLLEMLCDWKASTMRCSNGDIRKSIEMNQKRFGYSDELKQILLNTLSIIEK